MFVAATPASLLFYPGSLSPHVGEIPLLWDCARPTITTQRSSQFLVQTKIIKHLGAKKHASTFWVRFRDFFFWSFPIWFSLIVFPTDSSSTSPDRAIRCRSCFISISFRTEKVAFPKSTTWAKGPRAGSMAHPVTGWVIVCWRNEMQIKNISYDTVT